MRDGALVLATEFVDSTFRLRSRAFFLICSACWAVTKVAERAKIEARAKPAIILFMTRP